MTNGPSGLDPAEAELVAEGIVTIEAEQPIDPESVTTDNIPTARSVNNRGYWGGLIFLMLMLFELLAMGFALVGPILPALAATYQTAALGWVFTATTLTGAILVPLFGKLADLHGKRRMLLVAIGVNLAGIIICMLAPSFEIFLVGRALMGASITMGLLLTSLMRDILPKRYLGVAFGVVFTGAGVLSISSPFIAGFLNDNFGVHAIFIFLAVYSVLGALAVLFFIPESKIRVHVKIDFLGLLLLALGAAAIVLAIGQGSGWGWTSLPTLACLIGGVVILLLFFVYERARRDNHPLVEFDVLKSRGVIVLMVLGGISSSIASLYTNLINLLLQNPANVDGSGFGLTVSEAAVWMVGGGLTGFAAGVSAGTIGRKTGYKPLFVLAFLLVGANSVFLAFAHSEAWQIIVSAMVLGVGAGVLGATLPSLQVENVPPHQQGAAGGTIGTMNGIGLSVWVQLLFALIIATVVTYNNGAPVYNNTTWLVGWLFVAGLTVVGAVGTMLLPRHKPALAA